MVADPSAAFSRGDVLREIRELKDRVRVLETARTLEAASIGRGGLRLLDGGSIRVADGGDVIVTGGGAFIAEDGSRIIARYADGSTAVHWGSTSDVVTGEDQGHGILVQDNEAGDQLDIFRARRTPDGDKIVNVGSNTSGTPNPIKEMLARANGIELHAHGVEGSTDVWNLILSSNQEVEANADRVELNAAGTEAGSASVWNVVFNSDEDIFLTAADQIQLDSATDSVFVSSATTSNSPNVELADGFAVLRRSTSSRRYKTDLDHYTSPRTILDLKPRTYRDKAEAEADPDTARSHVGLVAEEVHDLGLHEYVTYDSDGNPDAVRYDRLAVGLLGIVQDLAGWAQAQGWQPQQGSALPTPPVKPAPAAKLDRSRGQRS